MALLERIKEDIKGAMKSGDRERLEVLRFVNSLLQNRAIEKRTAGQSDVLTDEDIMESMRKEVKRRKDAIELFKQGGRNDLVEKESKEVEIIQSYLPAAPTEEQVREVVQQLRQEGLSGFPVLMKEAMKRLKGADGNLVSKVVKESEG
ncbi:MAG: hypothetical protein A2855_02335 [Candidatus Liptonbacteria bacterium RIFCSPHIGHO2_01_FULL_57_28]|uniref:Glutamyl-tRNA amidotransferase n=1 Tax=Candidatus Liptonbacteria bacterium RIFCSPHIGHO2_01_FULL_57_28 TaxID=1798647 RepID=A0A1G2C934_9BACT|nr:MAG: hypothetical protein A2855_02335 [Candidatus Liptonbacteria bacterium RIFCSPHIGHO2_01_FULL_57_28]